MLYMEIKDKRTVYGECLYRWVPSDCEPSACLSAPSGAQKKTAGRSSHYRLPHSASFSVWGQPLLPCCIRFS